jgi:excisionase family DNA binding protein
MPPVTRRVRQQRIPSRVPLVTTTGAAAILAVSVRTVWRLIEEGELKVAGVIGNSNVFYRDQVEALRRRLYRD